MSIPENIRLPESLISACRRWASPAAGDANLLRALIALAASALLQCCTQYSYGSFHEGGYGYLEYQGRTYVTVEIGGQVWMAENLDYAVAGSKCYNNSDSYCGTYGRLYDWETAKTACPSGWHLPTKAEWDALSSYVQSAKGCSNCDAKHLKAASGWNDYNGQSGNGLDSYGFAALPGGLGSWWSASEDDSYHAYSRYMYYNNEYAYWNDNYKASMYSVRCLQD